MTAIRVGVIGVGHLGSFHARAYTKLNDAQLVTIYDADFEKARRRAVELNVSATNDLEELLESVDAVSVAVPTPAHHRITSQCLQRGIHVLVEKPLATNLTEADALIDLAKKVDVILQVGHIERFNPAFLALSHMNLVPMFIESHRLAPFTPRGSDVAVILDLMIHDIDLILALIAQPVQSVEATGVPVLSQSEDIANARVTFSNGAVANLTASRISAKAMRKMRLFGRNVYVSADFLEHGVELFRLQRRRSSESSQNHPLGSLAQEMLLSRGQTIIRQRPRLPKKDALELELQSFLNSIQKHQPPVVSGQDGRNALQLALLIMDRLSEHARWVQESTRK